MFEPENNVSQKIDKDIAGEIKDDIAVTIKNYINNNIENVSEFIEEMEKLDIDVLEVFARYKELKEGLGQINENVEHVTELVNRMAAAFLKANHKTGENFTEFLGKIANREKLLAELEKGLKEEMVSMISNGVFKFNIDNFIFYLKVVNKNLGLIRDYLTTADNALK